MLAASGSRPTTAAAPAASRWALPYPRAQPRSSTRRRAASLAAKSYVARWARKRSLAASGETRPPRAGRPWRRRRQALPQRAASRLRPDDLGDMPACQFLEVGVRAEEAEGQDADRAGDAPIWGRRPPWEAPAKAPGS